jgi:hypothetical protein
MNLSRRFLPVVVAAALATSITAAQAQTAEQKKLAAMAADDAAFRKAQQVQGRLPAEPRMTPTEKQDLFDRLCRIKPVMSDAEIDGCKKAYRL